MLDEGNLKTYSYHSYSTGPYPTCCHFSDCRTFLANFGNFCCTVNCFRKFGRKYISPLKLILEHVLPKSSIKGPKKKLLPCSIPCSTTSFSVNFEGWSLPTMTIHQRNPQVGLHAWSAPIGEVHKVSYHWLPSPVVSREAVEFCWCLNDLFYRFYSLHSHLEVEIRWWSEICLERGTCFHSLWNLW